MTSARDPDAIESTSFASADRACRDSGLNDASALLARALARDDPASSAVVADLDRALRLGSADPEVLAAVLAWHPNVDRRDAVARLLATNDRAGDEQVRSACRHLLDRGDHLVMNARRFGPRLTGWVASRSADPPALRLSWDAGTGRNLPIRSDPVVTARDGIRRWTFETILDVDGPVRLDASTKAGRASPCRLPARPVGPPRRRQAIGWRSSGAAQAPLAVVVPLYGDPESLSACLGALRRQTLVDLRVVLIDDASPDPEVSRLGQEFCRDRGGAYRRNALNAGFAATVNRGLSLSRDGDVLVLNSDVLLPDRALERLVRAAHSSADIGIVAPLSNDSGNTTFPDPMRPGPALAADEAEAIDRAAERANPGRTVDVPSALGSCFYVTRACIDRLGAYSLAFGRGYFEDVDLCLRARELGFRVVAACDVYVSHISGRSFKDERYALITRNGSVLDARFPHHGATDAAHDAADPLRPARAAIEEMRGIPGGPRVVLLGGEATARHIMDWREERLRSNETIPLLRLHWRRRGALVELVVSSAEPNGPRSLAFRLDDRGRRRLDAYIARCAIVRVEVFEPETIPAPVRDWLAASGLPATLVIDGRAAAAAALGMRRMFEGETAADVRLHPADGMTADCLAGLERRSIDHPKQDEAEARTRRQGTVPGRAARTLCQTAPVGPVSASASAHPIGCLGVPMPALEVAAERLVAALGNLFRVRGGPRLVVLGRCIDEAAMIAGGDLWVTGALTVAELPDAIESHGVDALFVPYRDRFRWLGNAATSRRSLPWGAFDWFPAAQAADRCDLALALGLPDDEACARLHSWCMAPPDSSWA